MTTKKHFKHLVRSRMAATGESYTEAAAQVRGALAEIRLDDPLTLDVHGRHGQAVTFTPDGARLLSAGQDARVAILDPRTGEARGELVGHEKVVNAIAVTPDGTRVVSVSSDRTARIWNLASMREEARLTRHKDAVVALALTPDGTHAITGGYDGRVHRWRLDDGACVDEHPSPLPRIAALAVTPDGTRTVEAGQGPQVIVRDDAGATVVELATGAPGVIGLAVAPDGGLLATAGYDGTVGLWSCQTWELLRTLSAGNRVNAIAFAAGGHLLAAAAAGRILVWSHDGDEPIASHDLHIRGVYALAFSADTRRLAQTGADGRVRVFTLR